MLLTALRRPLTFFLTLALSGAASTAFATDKALLDILLENGLISQPQFDHICMTPRAGRDRYIGLGSCVDRRSRYIM